ncbi:MAG: hypothetical protein BWY69_01213 [Planctomycetes bacterium ADurb.Bin401]|nr:MAG: hypothetical protein BWY69_01213 [Planctomycetes bacterium ADurb.Bin401]
MLGSDDRYLFAFLIKLEKPNLGIDLLRSMPAVISIAALTNWRLKR